MEEVEVTEEMEPVETEFTTEELEAMLQVVARMTKGVYSVPKTRAGEAPHLIKVQVNPEAPASDDKDGWMSIAALLQWGDDILNEYLSLEDHNLRTTNQARIANATTIAWVGNNLHRLLFEHLEMRDRLAALELLVRRE